MKYLDYRVGHIIPPFSLQYYYKNAIKAPYWEKQKQQALIHATEIALRNLFQLNNTFHIQFFSGKSLYQQINGAYKHVIDCEKAVFTPPDQASIADLSYAIFQKGVEITAYDKCFINIQNDLGIPHELYIYIGKTPLKDVEFDYNDFDLIAVHLIKDVVSEWLVKGYDTLKKEMIYKNALWSSLYFNNGGTAEIKATQIIKIKAPKGNEIAQQLRNQRILVSSNDSCIWFSNTPAHSKEQMEQLFDFMHPKLS